MRTLVVYRSKTGFVRKYAEWISEELQADLMEYSKADPGIFTSYDAVVYGGGLYAGGINGIDLITGNLDKLEGKKVAVFAAGASPPREEAIEEVKKANFTQEQLRKLKFFYMRGGFDYGRLGIADKFMMTLMKWKIRAKKRSGKALHPDETGMLAAYERPVDFTKKKNIEELVDYIRLQGPIFR